MRFVSAGAMVAAAVVGMVAVTPGLRAQDAPKDLFNRQSPSSAGTSANPYGDARRGAGDRGPAYAAMAQRDATQPVRNVILLIGDGMGDSEITMARNYAKGAGGYFAGIDALPVTGHYTHYSLQKESGKPNYVTDSAASATSFSSGIKTFNGALGVDIQGNRYPSVLTLAKQAGLATGNVTTAAIQDATPAAQYAHITKRSCFGPDETSENCASEALEAGGLGSITEQLLANAPDISLGGGMASFSQISKAGAGKGKSLRDQAIARGFSFYSSGAELAQLTALEPGKPVLGLFSDSTMPVRWIGPKAHRGGHLNHAPVACAPNPARTDTIPRLAAMTDKAIELLSATGKGFFLQVEGASIDKQSHAANPCGQIGETVDLDEAVQVALEFAKRDGNTLVIVTADHAHSGQIVANGSTVPGISLALATQDGAVMSISYGNGDEDGTAHTGTQLRVAAFGPYAFNVAGLLDQTDIHFIIRDALGLAGSAKGE